MKKTFLTLFAALICCIVFSFKADDNKSETTIIVTSDQQATFDFYQNLNSKEVRSLKGLKTPYEMRLAVSDGKFIVRQVGSGARLKIEVRRANCKLTADWPVTVVLVKDDQMSTFGME